MSVTHLTYNERAKGVRAPIAKKLLHLLENKKTNLSLSADVTSASQILALADLLGPEICLLKTHVDIIDDYTPAFTERLRKLSVKHEFLLFEDRKFADIGHTVKAQYEGGVFRIADWADIVNAHALPGPGIISGLAEIGQAKNRGLLLLAEMSSVGNLLDNKYAQQTFNMAQQFSDFVIGFITQHALTSDPYWINMTPGIQFDSAGDALGQHYTTPQKAIIKQGTDIIIVGRGILKAKDPLFEARKYRQTGWESYLQRCK